MQLSIRHETVYLYTAPQNYTIQQLRLWPRAEPHQHIVSWRIDTPGQRNAFIDAYGNHCHIMTITGTHHEARIVAEGVVNVNAPDRGRLPDPGALPPLAFTVGTRLLQADEAVVAFAQRHLRAGARGSDLLALADAVRGKVSYQTGATAVWSTAADALRLGHGVCQDHAHLFIACCHVHGIPARYVSGYIDPGTSSHAASHAWVDAWVEEADFCGWVSIDVTHARYADEAHCRIAVGRDYDSAAPVRGVRHGGGAESMTVNVAIRPLAEQ